MAALCALLIGATSATAVAPQLSKVSVSSVTSSSAVLEAEVNPQGKETTYRFEYGPEDCAKSTCALALEGKLPAGSSPVRVPAPLAELSPATVYHYRVQAENSDGKALGEDRIFATYSAPLIGLPDERAYEQASPTNKDGNDALGDLSVVKATASGDGITFGSTFGIPGGKGAQELPGYLASRGIDSWSTQGLLPPPSVGERAKVIGWTPNYTEVFSEATKLGSTRFTALIGQSTASGAPEVIAPYTADAEYAYAGASADGSVVLFESPRRVPPKEGKAPNPQALNEAPNLYAWDRESGEVRLAGIRNNGAPPPKGAFAGPYDWSRGISGRSLVLGGVTAGYYLQDEHAITPDGSIYFTEVGSGQLFLRRNPIAPQSAVVTNGKGEEVCTEEGKACTIHVSASHKENGISLDGTDPAGPQPAAFQAATADGREAFFTSPEKLTNDANTGPEQPPAQIERDDLSGGPVETPNFIPEHAVGVAVDGSHVYWANPKAGTIGRADLDGENAVPAFIAPGPVKFEFQFEVKPGVFETRKETIESEPRYVAVDAGHVYWTNTGRSDSEFGPVDKEGTIGRADIAGNQVNPEFIRGASNPQGIAVNASHIYWANAGRSSEATTIARAAIDGGEAEEEFFDVKGNGPLPYGVALNATHVYFDIEENGNSSFVSRIPLAGGPEEFLGIGKAGIRGVAVDASHVYWATQGEEAIGRADLELEAASRENEFIKLKGKPNGLAVDGAHLYWATNGEAPSNPGNDLYRFTTPSAGETGTLVDLTPDEGDENGAEVQGLVGASADGSYLYFAANGVLDDAEEAKAGSCHGGVGSASGACNLYLWHEGAIDFLARLRSEPGVANSDSLNWTGTPRNQFGGASYVPKSAFTSADGQTLLFRSQEKLTDYENEGVPELYRFHVGDAKIRCVSCQPGGEAAEGGPQTGRTLFPGLGPAASVAAVNSRVLSASGNQAFFETAEALSPLDTNGQGEAGCPPSGTGVQNFPACNDVYEWEAPGAGSCQESSPSYSPIDEGCLYLLSSGKDEFPSLFADASVSGKDVFFFTRQQLVGQDEDELQDVYDARVGGGLPAQNPLPPPPCESSEACRRPPAPPSGEATPATPNFSGPANPPAKHKKQKQAKHKKHKHKRGHGSHKKQGKAAAKGRGRG